MKRLLTMLLSAALLVSAFAGCGGEGKESSATSGETAGGSSSNQASTEETDWSSQEPYTVKLLIPGDAKTEDVEEVSAAASKILEEKYNTTLEIMRVGFGSYPDQVNLMLSSGEKLDVLYNNRDIFVSAINNGQIISMEEYLPEYGPDLLEQIPEERWATTSLNGEKYAVPANKEVAVSWGFSCVKEMADALALQLVDKHMVTDLIVLDVGFDVSNVPSADARGAYGGEVKNDRYGRRTPRPAHGSARLPRKTSSARLIIDAAAKLFASIADPRLTIRRLSIAAVDVVDEAAARPAEEAEQLDMFTDYEARDRKRAEEDRVLAKETKRQRAILEIKKKFGKNAILKGMDLMDGATARERNGQLGGHKA